MALPKVLKNMNVYTDGTNWKAEVKTITLPKITKKTEDYRGAGMLGDVALDMGYEKMECEISHPGFNRLQYAEFGNCGVDALPVRYVGSYEDKQTCQKSTVEYYARGTLIEVDAGDQELGSLGDFKSMYNLSYFRLTVDGEEVVELDFINGIERFAGTDLSAEVRQMLGL